MLPSDSRQLHLDSQPLNSSLPLADPRADIQKPNQQRTLVVTTTIDPNVEQQLPPQSRQSQTDASLIAPASRHQFLRTSTNRGKVGGDANVAAAAVFLWRRSGSEMDLEGKMNQEVEIGYKWLPQTPLKPAPNIPYQYPHHQYTRSATIAAMDEEPARGSGGKMQEQQRLSSSAKPRVIEGQRRSESIAQDPNHTNFNAPFPENRAADDRNKSVFFADGKRRIDFVLVYEQGVRLKPVDESRVGRSFVEKEKLRQFFQENLCKDGLELEEDVRKDDSNAQITVFVKVHGTWSALCRQAEMLKIKMPLRLRDTFAEQMCDGKPLFIYKIAHKIVSSLKNRLGLGQDSGDTQTGFDEPCGDGNIVTWAFQRKKIDKYAINDQSTFFTPTQRMEMVWEILQKARNDPADEKKRGIEQLLESGVYDSAFPLHDGAAGSGSKKGASTTERCGRRTLRRTWANWSCMFKPQPLELIRRYYGEKVGFYFAFLGFYTKMLAFPAFVGLCTFFYGISYSGDDALVLDLCDGHSAPGNFNMCPMCAPPACEVSQLHEACTNAMWDYRMDNEATLAMACLTVIWATVFLKSWKRREAELAYEWDTYEVEQSDSVIRPEYEKRAPARRHNPVTRELEPYVPATRTAVWMTASIFVTLLMLAGVGVALTALVLARIALYRVFKDAGIHESVECARWFVHGLIFVVVLIFDKIYNWVGRKTTSLECPRSQSQWLSSFLWKVFIFELLNDFVPIAYAAWVKGKSIRTPLDLARTSELCDSGGCMGEVTELIAVLLLARLVVGNASEIGIPFLKQLLKRICDNNKPISSTSASLRSSSNAAGNGQLNTHTEEGHEVEGRHQWSRDHMLGELELDGVAEEYMEMIVQFAFVTLFVPAFPIAPFVCLLNNILEIRVDAINFVVSHRRPLPIRVPGIQIWNSFLDIIAKVAILCNAALMSFTSEMIPRIYYKYTVNNGSSYDGFIQYSLSRIPAEAWLLREHQEAYDSFMGKNVTECWYQDFRTDDVEQNFPVTQRWWEVMCVRLVAFSIFIVAAFTFQWLYNFIVSDIPAHVTLKIQRRRYVVSKAMEAELAYDKWLKNTLHGKGYSVAATPDLNANRSPGRSGQPLNGAVLNGNQNMRVPCLPINVKKDSISRSQSVRNGGQSLATYHSRVSSAKISPPEGPCDSTSIMGKNESAI